MRLHWATAIGRGVGNSFGYTNTANAFRSGLESRGWELDDTCDTALHMTEPGMFEPIHRKRNVLYTMWESEKLDRRRIDLLRCADLIITPSRFCKTVFEQYTQAPVRIVPLGVDPDRFSYAQRAHAKPFVWLWVGAPNSRKGWDVLKDVWMRVFSQAPGAQLYMKTTGTAREGVDVVGNVTVDSRRVSDAELINLYHKAHAFVLPTAGEGFGLTLIEAMSTGLPCVTTRYSGVTDFTDPESVYYVGYDWHNSTNEEGRSVRTAYARPVELARAMANVMTAYPKALRVGKQARRRAQKFTWDGASDRLSDTLTRFIEQTNPAASSIFKTSVAHASRN